jgi:Na+/H+ antiporter NhaC
MAVCFFDSWDVVDDMSMILDVLVPIGFCVIFVSRQPTPYLQAAE